MTTITEDLELGDGSDATGVTVVYQLVGENGLPIREAYFNNTTVVGTVTPTVTLGAYSVDLTPNASITPSGTVWKRTATIEGSGSTAEYIVVPASGGPYVFATRLTDPPAAIESSALAAHIALATDAHDASAISYAGSSGISATNVEAAIDELDTEKAATASAVMDGDAAGGVLAGTYPNPSFASDMATQVELDAHAADTTDVHGITDTSALVTTGTLTELAQDVVGGMVTGNTESGITVTYDDTNGKLDFTVSASGAPYVYVAATYGVLSQTNFSTIDLTTDGTLSGYRQSTGAQNATVSWPFAVEAGTYTFTLAHHRGDNRGIYTVAIDGGSVGTVDGYNAGLDTGELTEITGIAITAGRKTLSLTMATKNASSSSFFGLIEGWSLIRTGA